MKHLASLFALCCCTIAMAEPIPIGYYDAADCLSDSLLKNSLHKIIAGGTRYEYGTNQYHSSANPPQWEQGDLKAYGTWQAFIYSDRREDGSVWDMYSYSQRYFPRQKGESSCSMNIEHCLPKSWWGGANNDAYKDLFNLNPADARANSQKSNYPPGHVDKADKFDNGSFRMDSKKSKYGYACFEPAEEYRGDFARTYFYMATAYEDLTWQSPYINNNTYLMFTNDIINTLLDWHRADPVSEKERCRADYISSVQHNRNPFIDYPELVEYIWGNKKGETMHIEDLTATSYDAECPKYEEPIWEDFKYDTIINLPAVTAAKVRAAGGYAEGRVQSNGTASITMGTSDSDGIIAFGGLNLQDTALLVFRASVYNTAEDMQIDIYGNDKLLFTACDTARQETRHERYYTFTLPAGTDSISLVSVGGSTKHRACMQELYLLAIREVSALKDTPSDNNQCYKTIHNGRFAIICNGKVYDLLGTIIEDN